MRKKLISLVLAMFLFPTYSQGALTEKEELIPKEVRSGMATIMDKDGDEIIDQVFLKDTENPNYRGTFFKNTSFSRERKGSVREFLKGFDAYACLTENNHCRLVWENEDVHKYQAVFEKEMIKGL